MSQEPCAHPAAVITVSDRCARGVVADRSGPELARLATASGLGPVRRMLVPDGVDSVRAALLEAILSGAHVVLTTGGTGVGPRDLTPEATGPVLTQELPGIAEEIRRRGAAATPAALLSRGCAGLATRPDGGRSLIVNLPGSMGAVRDGWAVLGPLIGHLMDQLAGGDH